jgi:ABC-type Fe3+-hydroxamate transport system substrate-binding protein
MKAERDGKGLIARLDFYMDMVRSRQFSPAARDVAIVLLYRHMNGRTGRCYPAIATLMEETPPQGRREKPRLSAFTSANIDKILALKTDLVLTFSDLQADIAVDLIRQGLNVDAFNQRSIAGILDMIRMLGAVLDASERRSAVGGNARNALAVRSRAARLPKRPRVFFEEWDDPLISGIGWVSELVEINGEGQNIRSGPY